LLAPPFFLTRRALPPHSWTTRGTGGRNVNYTERSQFDPEHDTAKEMKLKVE
jgi:hypothetical protein